jgi:ABC-type glycerol-3-phosphate transport system substrate-binding protein
MSKEKKISRRKWLKYTGAAVAAAAIAAAGYYATQPKPTVPAPVTTVTPPTITQSTAKAAISWLIHPVFNSVTGNGELVRKFTTDTGIQVNTIAEPYDTLLDKVATEFAAGTSQYDVISYPSEFFLSRMSNYLVSLDDYIKSAGPNYNYADIAPGFASMFNVPFGVQGGKIYGIPARIGVDVLHYRKDLFEQYGLTVPKYMDDFLDVATKLTMDTAGGKMYGAVIRGAQTHTGVVYGSNAFVGAFDAKIFDFEKKQCTVNSDRALEAFQFHNDLYSKYHVVPPGVLTYDYDGIQIAINQGLAATALMWNSYCLGQLDPKNSKVVGKIGYAPIPCSRDSGLQFGKGTYSGWGFLINKNSKNIDAAWEFIKYLTSVDGHLYMALHQNGSPRFSTYRDPGYKQVFPAAEATEKAMSQARHCSDGPISVEADDLLQLFLTLGLSGKESTKDALDHCYQGLAPLLPGIFGPKT